MKPAVYKYKQTVQILNCRIFNYIEKYKKEFPENEFVVLFADRIKQLELSDAALLASQDKCKDLIEYYDKNKQKLNLLAILLLEPEVLLLDEPTALLDPESAQAIMTIIGEYSKNKTVVIIEHNLHYLQQLVTRNIHIDAQGHINEIELSQIEWQAKLTPCSLKAQTNNPPCLELRQLSFAYPQQPLLLKNINFTIFPGEICAMRGANGSGKSSLLKLISAIIPSQQSIYWHGNDLATLNRYQLWQNLSLLWQNPEAHFLANSVAEELNHDQSALAQVNLSAQSKQSPFNLSEGQKRRLSLAIVLQTKPQLLLLDEPTFGQDFSHKQQLTDLICQLAAQGTSIIIVSHDLGFIQALATRVYQLKDGELKPC